MAQTTYIPKGKRALRKGKGALEEDNFSLRPVKRAVSRNDMARRRAGPSVIHHRNRQKTVGRNRLCKEKRGSQHRTE